MKKIIAWVLVLIVLAGGVYWINKLSYKATPLVQDSINSTDSWKAYTNNKYGFSFRYPQNYILYGENSNGYLAMFRDQSKVFPNPDVHNLIMVGAFPANKEVSFDNYIKKYPKVNGNTNRPFVFTPRVLGKNTFYYTLTERFEGTLSFVYCILNNDAVLCFHSESNGVAWSDENLDVEVDSTHVALRNILSTIKFTSPTVDSTKKTIELTIQVPENMSLYLSEMNKYIFEGKPNPSMTWKFIPKKVTVPYTTGVIRASAQAAAEQIETQGGIPSAEVVYLKIIDKTAYILLAMHIDGWAGSSISSAKIKPLVEKTLLQFPEISSVIFNVAPGDSKDQVSESYTSSSVSKPSITVLSPNGGESWKINSKQNITWNNTKMTPVDIKLVRKNSPSPYTTATIVEKYSSDENAYVWNNGYTYSTLHNPIDGDAVVEFPGIGQYIIQVCESGTTNCDESDNIFKITN